jgi:hypothetical protein
LKNHQKPIEKVKSPGTGEMVNLNEISKAGGFVNAYEAIKLASTLKGERTKTTNMVKSTVKPKTKVNYKHKIF